MLISFLLLQSFTMQEKNDQPSNFTNLIIIGLILLSAYLLYTLTLAFYRSHNIDVHIRDFEEKNKKIEEENRKLLEEYEYVTSDAYIDKKLKENMGLVNPGEEVIVITSELPEEEDDPYNIEGITKRDYDSMNNIEKWRIFVFMDNPLR